MAPQQERSRRTLEKILAAAEELLGETLFESMGMNEIARRAGVSVGTIYTRFPNKDALLPALLERHDVAAAGAVASLLPKIQAEASLERRVAHVVRFAIRYHVERRGLLRALTMYVRAHPESVTAQTWRERQGQYAAVAGVVAGDAGVRADAVEFVLGVVNSVCREQVLFGDVTPLKGRRSSSTRGLEKRLTTLAFGYLSDGSSRAR